MRDMSDLAFRGAFIHEKVLADSTVRIGAGTKVWQFASIIRGASIGEDCNIASCAIVDGAVLGDRCSVGHGASVHPGFRGGSDVFIGPGAVICNDLWPKTGKEGFNASALMSGEVVTVIAEDGAVIGAGAVVLPGVKLGIGSMVAAGAVCDRDVPRGCVFNRNGYIGTIPADRDERRMRWAKS